MAFHCSAPSISASSFFPSIKIGFLNKKFPFLLFSFSLFSSKGLTNSIIPPSPLKRLILLFFEVKS
jgi:hypothetical protein